MHDSQHTPDDIVFDRLVDGELSADERRQLLASLDGRPGGWRECALAFLEAQAWKEQLQEVVHPSPSEKKRAARTSRAGVPRQNVSLLALAASLLVAFTLGLALRGSLFPLQSPAPDPTRQIAGADAPAPNLAGAAPNTADAVTFWVRDESGRSRPLRVPLVDAGTWDRQHGLKFQSALSPDMREELSRNGFDVVSKRRYAPMWLENGRPLVVPVEDTRIVPVSQAVY